MEASYEVWLWLAKRFLRRRCFKSVDDDGRRRRMDNEACLYYKFTYEPKGSGELITDIIYITDNLLKLYYYMKRIV